MPKNKSKDCNLCGHLQRCQMPDIENRRKNSRKGWRVGHGKTAEKQLKNSRNTLKTVVFRVFRLFFELFFGCFTVTHSPPFSAVFRLFSMSGIWHLCRSPQKIAIQRSILGTSREGTFVSQGSCFEVPLRVCRGAVPGTAPFPRKML